MKRIGPGAIVDEVNIEVFIINILMYLRKCPYIMIRVQKNKDLINIENS